MRRSRGLGDVYKRQAPSASRLFTLKTRIAFTKKMPFTCA
jgi:hypothetical protein